MQQEYSKALGNSECLSDNDLAAYIDGAQVGAQRQQADAHLGSCQRCSELLGLCALSLPESSEPEQERYRIDALVGRGSVGAVYRAFDNVLGRHVALKFLRQDSPLFEDAGTACSRPPNGEARAIGSEARLLAKLSHPNIVGIHDLGELDGRAYVAMEMVDGETLLRWLEARPRTPTEVVAVIAQAGRGLDAAHRAGVVHRDIKPSNILVGDDGRVRLVDFGLASARGDVHRLHEFVGTRSYRAPELSQAHASTAESDQYSLALTAHQALTGLVPEPSVVLDCSRLPRALIAPMRRALAPVAAQRFTSTGAFVSALEASLRAPIRRMRVAALVAASLGLILLVVLATRSAAPPAPVSALPKGAAARAELGALEGELEALKTMATQGQYDEALSRSGALLERSQPLAYAPLTASLLLFRGQLQTLLGKLDAAERTYRAAASAAARSKDDAQVAEVWIKVLDLLVLQNRFDEALTLEKVAVTSAERVPGDSLMQARLQRSLGAVYFGLEQYRVAQTHFSAALTTFRNAGPSAPQWLPAILGNLSLTKMALGDTEGALVSMSEALALAIDGKGHDHPEVGYLHLNIASLQSDAGLLEPALRSAAEALRIFLLAFDDGHPNVASVEETLSTIATKSGRLAPAVDHIEKALSIRSAALGEENLAVLTTLHTVATAHLALGTDKGVARAEQVVTRAREIHVSMGSDAAHLRSITVQLEEELNVRRSR